MTAMRGLAAIFAAATLWLSAASAAAQPAAANAEAQVYLLRGLFNVFSLGMDELAEKLKKYGFRPTVSTWESGHSITSAIAGQYGNGARPPIFLIGHSLGANTTFQIATDLQGKSIPVTLIVTFDPTVPGVVPANVVRFINFYAHNGFGHRAQPGPGFTGELDNLDLTADGVTHDSIDALDRYHQFVIARMLEAMKSQAAAKPPHAPKKQPPQHRR